MCTRKLQNAFSLLIGCKRKRLIQIAAVLSTLVLLYHLFLGNVSGNIKYRDSLEGALKNVYPKGLHATDLPSKTPGVRGQAQFHDGRVKVIYNRFHYHGPGEMSLEHGNVGNQSAPVNHGAVAHPLAQEKAEPRMQLSIQEVNETNEEKRVIKPVINPPVIPKHYKGDPAALQNYRTYLNRVEKVLPLQTRAVIILTNHRSGSSFFGELFNQHPDAFYFFEPLFPLSFSGDCSINAQLKTEAVIQLAQCKLPDWIEMYKTMPQASRMKNGVNLHGCLAKKMCFPCNTKETLEEKHCPRSKITRLHMNCLRDCGIVNPLLAMNDCRRKKLVALKLIRLCDILQLEKLVRNTPVDIKILHLLRDPRGIANSRRGVLPRIDLKESMRSTCLRQARNVHTAAFKTPDWLKGKYKLFRYEDVATLPYETAKSVYDFVGLDLPDVMKEWIANNTDATNPFDVPPDGEVVTLSTTDASLMGGSHASLSREKREFHQKRIAQRGNRPKHDPYSTKRNSTAIVLKWSKILPHVMVKTIEDVCKGIMGMVGYKPVGSREEYMKKDSDVKYFTDMPSNLKDLGIL